MRLRAPEKFGIALLGLGFVAIVALGIIRSWPMPVDDLDAQRNMANAAWAMVWLTGGSILVGALSLYLIARTLLEARRSAAAGEAAVLEARANTVANERIGRAQVRAYVGISKVTLAHDGVDWRLSVSIHNAGQSPARAVGITPLCRELRGDWNSLVGVRFFAAQREGIGTGETTSIEFAATAEPPSIGGFFHGVVDIEVEYLDVFNDENSMQRSFVLEDRVRMLQEYEMRPYTPDNGEIGLPRISI